MVVQVPPAKGIPITRRGRLISRRYRTVELPGLTKGSIWPFFQGRIGKPAGIGTSPQPDIVLDARLVQDQTNDRPLVVFVRRRIISESTKTWIEEDITWMQWKGAARTMRCAVEQKYKLLPPPTRPVSDFRAPLSGFFFRR